MLGTVEIVSTARVSVVFKNVKGTIDLNQLNPFKLILGDIYGKQFYEEQWTTAATTTNTITLSFGVYSLFIPGATYKLKIMCTNNGSWEEFNSITFQGPAGIAPPLTAIAPKLPAIRNQTIYGNCVAMSLATAMDVLKMKSMGSEFENYSTSYIYGNGAGLPNEQGMYLTQAIDNVLSQGSPRVDIANNKASLPLDTMSVTDSVTLHNNAPAYAVQNALKQRFVSPEMFDFYNAALLHSYLSTYGVVVISLELPQGFNGLSGANSVLPPPGQTTEGTHAMAIIGATVINSKLYWIAQNSWGTNWGDGGRVLIPWDYGSGTTYTATWGIYESAKLTNPNISNTHPSEVTSVQGTKISATQATITWQSSNPAGTYYLVLAAITGSNQYWFKGRTTNKSLLITLDQERSYDIKVIAEDSSYRYSKGTVETYVHGVGFQWTYPVGVGEEIKITAGEYNALIDLLNLKWPWTGDIFPTYIYKVSVNTIIGQYQVKDMLWVINIIATNGYDQTYPSYPNYGDEVLAQHWINIANNYNAIP